MCWLLADHLETLKEHEVSSGRFLPSDVDCDVAGHSFLHGSAIPQCPFVEDGNLDNGAACGRFGHDRNGRFGRRRDCALVETGLAQVMLGDTAILVPSVPDRKIGFTEGARGTSYDLR